MDGSVSATAIAPSVVTVRTVLHMEQPLVATDPPEGWNSVQVGKKFSVAWRLRSLRDIVLTICFTGLDSWYSLCCVKG